jgi:hypothetical protein
VIFHTNDTTKEETVYWVPVNQEQNIFVSGKRASVNAAKLLYYQCQNGTKVRKAEIIGPSPIFSFTPISPAPRPRSFCHHFKESPREISRQYSAN